MRRRRGRRLRALRDQALQPSPATASHPRLHWRLAHRYQPSPPRPSTSSLSQRLIVGCLSRAPTGPLFAGPTPALEPPPAFVERELIRAGPLRRRCARTRAGPIDEKSRARGSTGPLCSRRGRSMPAGPFQKSVSAAERAPAAEKKLRERRADQTYAWAQWVRIGLPTLTPRARPSLLVRFNKVFLYAFALAA